MNERIKEITDRSKNRSQYLLSVLCNKTNRTSTEITDIEKQEVFNDTFANLIIQETLDIVDSHTEVFQTERDLVLIEHIKKSLNKHFGVEE